MEETERIKRRNGVEKMGDKGEGIRARFVLTLGCFRES